MTARLSGEAADEKCPHCPDGHEAPERRPWAVWVRLDAFDHDNQPTMLTVCKTGGQHVSESDAEWLRDLIRTGRQAQSLLAAERGAVS